MRYLPLTKNSRQAMLQSIGVKDVDALYKDVPKEAFIKGLADLPLHKGEIEVERLMGAYANQNNAAPDGPFFLGAGTYYHHVPATVDYVIQRSEFLTAYTPYQPEIAQGTLQVIFEYQTMISRLTGQDVANASMYCGSTALAEAALMAMRVTKRRKIAVGTALHPHYREVLKAYMGNFGDVTIVDGEPDDQAACVIVQSPDFFGTPHKYEKWRELCDKTGALLVVLVTEIVSLGLLPPPAQADIVCGEAQSIGLAMGYGGPHLGFFACKEAYLRQMPGRLCGMTEDADGKRGFVLTLSTREQHIRRDKATSNICTNQGLCALAFTVHLALLGEEGFRRLARLNHEAACRLAEALSSVGGVKIENESFFNEFVIELPGPAKPLVEELAGKNIIAGYPLEEKRLLVAATEMTTAEDIRSFAKALKESL
ncbi:MAG: aminomethyl-transferring glycine dehydrogenase subunit GcvPA [Alphaproteobacteria bacterium]|nr:aminomethyl-transferring glycine dehydrogenase subunit GcvPA [Alphaproteobacteria bacterium]MCB1839203.1 aminomethyl-transferring glycine dehydrogenase subunit GcvPA [Alphaproteobacteria bacterium]